MPWCGEDVYWLGCTLELMGIACLVSGAAFLVCSGIIILRRRRAGCTDMTTPRGLVKWWLLSFLGIQLCVVLMSLALSAVSPLSRGNAWARVNLASVKAYREGHFAEAEVLGRTALRLAEHTRTPDEHLCQSLARLRDYCAAQKKLVEAKSFQRRLAEICIAQGDYGEVVELIMALEKGYGVSVPDDVLEKCETIDCAAEYLVRAARSSPRTPGGPGG
jgi:hypothetical protein